jgi:uncharacterized protein YjlB
MSTIVGRIAYHAGAAGTVALAKGERVLHIRALGAAGATLTIDGGDVIPLPATYMFDDANNARTEEWVGSSLVFTSTLSYFVKTLKPFVPIP